MHRLSTAPASRAGRLRRVDKRGRARLQVRSTAANRLVISGDLYDGLYLLDPQLKIRAMGLALEAVQGAIADAGLRPSDVDGAQVD